MPETAAPISLPADYERVIRWPHFRGRLARPDCTAWFAGSLLDAYAQYAYVHVWCPSAWYDVGRGRIIRRDPGRHFGGYFRNLAGFARSVGNATGVSIYICPNPVEKDVDRPDRLYCFREGDGLHSCEVGYLRWIIIDVDPVGRQAGSNATDDEHSACVELMLDLLRGEREIFESCYFGSSGNGAYILIRVDDLPNDSGTADAARLFIGMLADRYRGDHAEIDTHWCMNKSIGLPGSWKCKAAHAEGRPRRMVDLRGWSRPVAVFDLDAWLADHGADVDACKVASPSPRFLDPDGSAPVARALPARRTVPAVDDIGQARDWIDRRPPAVSGQRGRAHTFSTACTMLYGWDLSEHDTLMLMGQWNLGCIPPWSDRELSGLVRDAAKTKSFQAAGYMRRTEH